MTEAQARKLIEQVQQEFPEQILTRISEAKGGRNGGTCHTVRLQFDGRILTAYKPDQWLEIKWVWGLEDEAPETKRQIHPKYLVDGIPMSIACGKNGYWFARYWHGGKEFKKHLGRVDPRPQYPIVEKKEEVTI